VIGTGTAINIVTVLAGGTLGIVIGARLSQGMRETAMNAIGLVTVLVGVQSFLRFDNPIVPLVSVIVGLVIGESSASTMLYSASVMRWSGVSRKAAAR
jgi:uncharacterized membrane protein YqgA involved in biofilm formation